MESDTKIEEQAEFNPLTLNAKSSVTLKKNTKGIFWDIKVVSGEKDLIDGLMKTVLDAHNKLHNKLDTEIKKLEAQLNEKGGKK